MVDVAEEHGTARDKVEGPPIDVDLISTLTDKALALRLTTSTRDEIMAFVPELDGALRMLAAEDFDPGGDVVILALLNKTKLFLDSNPKPSDVTPPFRAYAWTREAASLTRRLLWLWCEMSGVGHP
ncbi:hypothetical protein ACGFZC_15975 [[Kitasatospora] papulosa]|uniref:hypothetical protein n=1 Tax=[Kitasatospora] papulosa TaxID=1464011 RepID=UPI003724B1BD